MYFFEGELLSLVLLKDDLLILL